ncbi:MAG: metallophosphoesterase [Bacteroidota bacterium]
MSQPTYRLAHLSDVHFGRIDSPSIVDALVEEVNAARMDLVVVSGDLTQRARRWQFLAARAFLDRFTAPVLVVPGNHDVTAWWHNPVERVYRPVRKYQRYVTDDLAPTFEATRAGLPSLAVLGLNSAHGRTIKGGFLQDLHRAQIVSYFKEQPQDAYRVFVVHHHMVHLDALGEHDIALGAAQTLKTVADAGVDLILCGHIHKSTVAQLEVTAADGRAHRLVIASAGTATSNRSREVEGSRTNYYNWCRIDAERLVVQERRFDHEAGHFHAVRDTSVHHRAAVNGVGIRLV